MPGLLQSIAQDVDRILSAEYPQAAWQSHFEPLLDLTLGDLGSDILQRIAHELRISPFDVGAQVLLQLNTLEFGTFSIVDGFLNLRLNHTMLGKPWNNSIVIEDAPSLILVAPRKRGNDLAGYARVLASASVQWFLTGQRAKVRSLYGDLSSTNSWSDFRSWFVNSTIQECEQLSHSAWKETLAPLFTQLPQKKISFWGYADFLARKDFSSFVKILAGGSEQSLSLQVLDRTITTRIIDVLDTEQLSNYSNEEFAALLVYLSRANNGTDIDLAAACYQERANLRWSLHALVDRLTSWNVVDRGDPVLYSNVSPEEFALTVRWRSLPLFRVSAANHGKIGQYLAALEDMIDRARRYVNNPKLRLQLERGDFSPVQAQIIAGVTAAASDTIHSCFLFQKIDFDAI